MVYKYCTEKANFLLPIYEYRGVLAYTARCLTLTVLLKTAGEDGEERLGSTDESAEIREAGRHGRSDVPQRGVRLV